MGKVIYSVEINALWVKGDQFFYPVFFSFQPFVSVYFNFYWDYTKRVIVIVLLEQHDKSSPFNSTHYVVLYPQNGDRTVTILWSRFAAGGPTLNRFYYTFYYTLYSPCASNIHTGGSNNPIGLHYIQIEIVSHILISSILHNKRSHRIYASLIYISCDHYRNMHGQPSVTKRKKKKQKNDNIFAFSASL